jgi:hypothetical protein
VAPLLRRTARLASGALLIGALIATASPASAMATPDSPTNLTRINTATPTTQTRQADVPSYQATRFNYTGTFRNGTQILDVDWHDIDHRFRFGMVESFGIAPNGTIWHAWPGSGGWKEMPGRGRADNTVDSAHHGATTSFPSRTVKVWVNGSGHWCNTDDGHDGGRWFPGWYHCS